MLCHSLRLVEKNYALYDKQKSGVSANHTVKGVKRCNFNDRDNGDKNSICEYGQVSFKNIFKDELEKQSITIDRVREVIFQKEELFEKFKIDDKFVTKVPGSVRYNMKVNTKNESRSRTGTAGFTHEPVTH